MSSKFTMTDVNRVNQRRIDEARVEMGREELSVTGNTKSPKRLRQDLKPLLNKLEGEWLLLNKSRYPNYPSIRAQAKRYKLGNGIWYKPDFTVSSWPGELDDEDTDARETAFEIKGPHSFRGGFENLKVAAHLWPEVRFVLCWKQGGQWRMQRIVP